MPTEAVLNQLSSRKVTESLMMQIILHCAPVLKDIKMSSMFTVPAAYLRFVRSAFRGTGIRVKCLCQGAGRAVVYVYREAEVQQYAGRSLSESSRGARFPVGPWDGALSP